MLSSEHLFVYTLIAVGINYVGNYHTRNNHMKDREFTVSSSIGLALQHQEPIPLISEFKKNH